MVKPGIYVVAGGKSADIKNLSLLDPSAWGLVSGNTNPSLMELAKQVEWVFIALNKRREQIAQTPYQWIENGREIDEAPFMLDSDMLERIDMAVQLYSAAYMHKRRTRGRRFDALGWLDPATISPVTERGVSVYGGYEFYRRTTNENRVESGIEIPATDLLKIERLGMAELKPGISAGEATKAAASILAALNRVADGIYDRNNGLPVMLVKVPMGASEQERTRLADRFRSLFNSHSQGFGEQKTVGVPEGVEVVPLSLSPNELVLSDMADGRINAILAAHGVPKSMVMGDTANFATAQAERQNFALNIAHRLRWIAGKFNSDPDMQSLGLTLDINPQELAVTLEDQERRVNIWTMFVDRGIDTRSAFDLAGLDVPDNLNVATMEAEPVDEGETPVDEEIRKLRKFIKRGGHLKRQFESDILTPEEVEFYTALEVGTAQDTPFYP